VRRGLITPSFVGDGGASGEIPYRFGRHVGCDFLRARFGRCFGSYAASLGCYDPTDGSYARAGTNCGTSANAIADASTPSDSNGACRISKKVDDRSDCRRGSCAGRSGGLPGTYPCSPRWFRCLCNADSFASHCPGRIILLRADAFRLGRRSSSQRRYNDSPHSDAEAQPHIPSACAATEAECASHGSGPANVSEGPRSLHAGALLRTRQ
jgi:hypothetical protein